MQQYEETIVQLFGFTIALKIWHDKKIKPILCLHGKMDNAASFDLLAPYLNAFKLISVDYPGTGYSSHYPDGILPNWKNDALLLLDMLNSFGWQKFDIIAHSLGSLVGLYLAIVKPKQVKKIIFLDILGPRPDLVDNKIINLHKDSEIFLNHHQSRTIFPSKEALIVDRMKTGNISYHAAKALATRGAKEFDEGWQWTFDRRLRCVSTTLPHEDELRVMLSSIEVPICLIQANQGIHYPEQLFQERSQSIKNLTIHKVDGGHHVHMDDPAPIAKIVSSFLTS